LRGVRLTRKVSGVIRLKHTTLFACLIDTWEWGAVSYTLQTCGRSQRGLTLRRCGRTGHRR